jgi:hypothetical protein
VPSAAEISSWSPEQIRAEITRLLPADCTFTESVLDGWAHGAFNDKAGAILWEGSEPDRRILLLSAYGWIWTRGRTPKHPAWKLRKPGGAMQTPKQGPEIPDPPDLDPVEINKAVYEKQSKR